MYIPCCTNILYMYMYYMVSLIYPVYIEHAGSDSGIVEARRSSVNAQFHRGHNRSRSSDTHLNGIVKSPQHTALSLVATHPQSTDKTAASTAVQRQCSAPSFADSSTHRPDSMDFSKILDNLNQLTKQLDDTCSNTSSNNGNSVYY